MEKRVAVLIGSLRLESYNRKMAQNLIKMAPPELQLEIIEIGDLQMYNEDLDKNPPESWVLFRKTIKSYDAVLFITPEYNRSVPAVLKNALDVGSRPYGKSIWSHKPAGVISVSPGAVGGFGANHHLRQSLVFLNCPVMQQPEAYIGGADKIFDEHGEIAKEDTLKLMYKFLVAFDRWVETVVPEKTTKPLKTEPSARGQHFHT